MRIQLNDIQMVNTGAWIILTLRIPQVFAKMVEVFRQRFMPNMEYEIKLIRKKRSLDANAFCWKICSEIANAVGETKEQVYKDAIGHVGVFDILTFTDTEVKGIKKSRYDAMDAFKVKWHGNGIGWFTKTLDKDKCVLQVYYGSSRYNTQEMAVLIDYLVQEADELDIHLLTSADIDLLKQEWK